MLSGNLFLSSRKLLDSKIEDVSGVYGSKIELSHLLSMSRKL